MSSQHQMGNIQKLKLKRKTYMVLILIDESSREICLI